jgi:hypothetical protein
MKTTRRESGDRGNAISFQPTESGIRNPKYLKSEINSEDDVAMKETTSGPKRLSRQKRPFAALRATA